MTPNPESLAAMFRDFREAVAKLLQAVPDGHRAAFLLQAYYQLKEDRK